MPYLVRQLFTITCSATACLATVILFHNIGVIGSESEIQTRDAAATATALTISNEIDHTWRFTEHGWQDASQWVSPSVYHHQQTIEMIHPFVMAGLLLLSVVIMMIWASSEWEVARVFARRPSGR